jgi:hypothetical protein
MGVPIVWWRKPYGGLDGHGASPGGRCEGSLKSSEVSSLGKLSVFSKSPIGTLGTPIITVLEMLPGYSGMSPIVLKIKCLSYNLPK